MQTVELDSSRLQRITAQPMAEVAPSATSVATRTGTTPLRVCVVNHFGRTGYNIMRALGALGAEVFLIIDDRSESLRYTRKAKVVWRVDQIGRADSDDLAQRINELHAEVGLDSVIASDVDSLLALARIRDRVIAPLYPIADRNILHLLDNKWSFGQLCAQVGVAIPHTIYFSSKSEFDRHRVADKIGFPCIIKPAAGYGQRGIEILRDMTDAYVFESLQVAYPYGMVVQELIQGHDWAVSVFARDGEIKHWTSWECPGQLDSGQGVSRFLTTDFCARSDLFDMAARICRATNFSGVANFDTRLDTSAGKMVMFECNPRFFGRLAAARLCGLDFVAAGIPGCDAQPECLDNGRYYPWQELFTRRGIGHLRAGRWKWSILKRDLYEMFWRDPLPPIMRKLHREDSKP